MYMRELRRTYSGNRAPVALFLHAARLIGSQEVADQYAAFFAYALSLPNTWVVTISEVRSGTGAIKHDAGWEGCPMLMDAPCCPARVGAALDDQPSAGFPVQPELSNPHGHDFPQRQLLPAACWRMRPGGAAAGDLGMA